MHCVFLYGEPGCGKTTLMREFLATCGEKSLYQHGLVKCELFPEKKIVVLGRYTNNPFSGTDRLSMGVQSDVPGFIREFASDPYWYNWVILGEGARIATRPALDAFSEQWHVYTYFLRVGAFELERRRASRNNTQNQAWLDGMHTKLVRLEAYAHHACTVVPVAFSTHEEKQNLLALLEDMSQARVEYGVL